MNKIYIYIHSFSTLRNTDKLVKALGGKKGNRDLTGQWQQGSNVNRLGIEDGMTSRHEEASNPNRLD